MIYRTMLAPSETPPTMREVKRALLTFDKVLITDPRDRDIIPPQAIGIAIGLPPIIGASFGPVRPLGKSPGYDNEFDKLLDQCKQARSDGVLDVISTYSHQDTITIGAVLMGGYPLNPRAMLAIYRSLARDNEFLMTAIRNDSILTADANYIEAVELANCSADGSINNDPATPLIEGEMGRQELRTAFTNIARARLAAIIKTIGYCAAKELVPFFSNAFQHNISWKIVANSRQVIDELATEDMYWINRSLALRVAHEEFLDEAVLDQMSIGDVLKLRTKAWGEQANARDGLMKSVAEISRELDPTNELEKECKEKIRQYRSEAEKLERERSALKLKIKCEIGIAIGGTVTAGTIAQVQTAVGAATVLLAGCVYALKKIKDYGPVRQSLKAAEEEFKDNAGFGLYEFYKTVPDALRR